MCRCGQSWHVVAQQQLQHQLIPPVHLLPLFFLSTYLTDTLCFTIQFKCLSMCICCIANCTVSCTSVAQMLQHTQDSHKSGCRLIVASKNGVDMLMTLMRLRCGRHSSGGSGGSGELLIGKMQKREEERKLRKFITPNEDICN